MGRVSLNEKYVLNPSKADLEKSKLDLVVAGTKDAVLMVESEANGVTEEEMLIAVKFGQEGFVRIRVDGKEENISDKIDLKKNIKHNIEVIVPKKIIRQS